MTHLRNSDKTVIEKLTAMGITPGISIALEQNFPTFVIKAGETQLSLDAHIASSVYVRVMNS